MKRLRLVTISFALVALGATFVSAHDSGAPILYVEGYVDQAPAGVEPIETVQITRDGHDRVLIIVTARSGDAKIANGVGDLPLRLQGGQAEVGKLMGADAGSKVRAVLKYYPGSQTLLVNEIDS